MTATTYKPAHIFRASVWGADETRTSVAVCPDCFLALHDAGFHRVGGGGQALDGWSCSICGKKREREPKREPASRITRRAEGIEALRAKLAPSSVDVGGGE